MKISVLGLGYIGLPTGIVLAKAGYQVLGYDVNYEVIKTLNSGQLHIVENNLLQAYKDVWQTKKFKAYSELQKADVYIIAVPTPFIKNGEEKEADLSYVFSATHEIAKILKKGDLVILESTVPPKTTRKMTDILEKESGLVRTEFHTVHCPERVLPGRILYELEHNDRIIGSERKESSEMAKKIYDSFVKKGTNYITDDVTAEMAKVVENSFRDVNIAFANELSVLCEDLDINVYELIELANKHPRVNILNPGVGVGGHCISVDPWFLIEMFPEKTNLIYNARKTNDFKPMFIANKVKEKLKNKDHVIGILGLAYKPDIDDLRESPSIELAKHLIKQGYNVVACEPNIKNTKIDTITNLDIKEIMEQSDLLVVTLLHKEFKEPEILKQIVNKDIIDCVGIKKVF